MRIYAIILSLIIVFTFCVDTKDELSEKQQKLQSIQEKMRQHKDFIYKTDKQARDVFKTIKSIEADLLRQNRNHLLVNTQISKTKEDINLLEVKIAQEKSKFSLAQDSLTEKIDKFYRLSNTNIVENIFEIENFTEYLNQLYFFEQLITDNLTFLNEVKEIKEKLTNHENNLNYKLGDLKYKEGNIVNLKEKISENMQQKEKLYTDLMAQKKEYEKQLRELETDSREIQQLIAKSQKKTKIVARMGDGRFIWPITGQITSYFGERVHPIFKIRSMHTGLDIAASSGRPIFAAEDGVVIFSGSWGGYGKTIILDHGAAFTTLYGHMSQYFVKEGVAVKKGQIIGLVGSTGWSTGPHLHFEVRIDGVVQNPINYLPNL